MNKSAILTVAVTAILSFALSAFAFRIDLADKLADRVTSDELEKVVAANSAYLRDRALVMAQLLELGELTKENRTDINKLHITVAQLADALGRLAERREEDQGTVLRELADIRTRLRALERQS